MKFNLRGVVEQADEKFAAQSRGAAVKAKGELVQVAVQMAVANGPLMIAQRLCFPPQFNFRKSDW